MFTAFQNLPGVYRQISLTPKYYHGDNQIVVISNATLITQEEIFTSAVYRINTGASKVVFHCPAMGVEKEIPTDDVVSSIDRYYEEPDHTLTIYHSKNIFAVVVKPLFAGVPFVEVAGYDYDHLRCPHADEIIDVDADIDTVEELLEFVSEQ